jgi:hypothetical protein
MTATEMDFSELPIGSIDAPFRFTAVRLLSLNGALPELPVTPIGVDFRFAAIPFLSQKGRSVSFSFPKAVFSSVFFPRRDLPFRFSPQRGSRE